MIKVGGSRIGYPIRRGAIGTDGEDISGLRDGTSEIIRSCLIRCGHLGQVGCRSVVFQLINIGGSRICHPIWIRIPSTYGKNIAGLRNGLSEIIMCRFIGCGHLGQVGSRSIGFQLINVGGSRIGHPIRIRTPCTDGKDISGLRNGMSEIIISRLIRSDHFRPVKIGGWNTG